MKAAFMPTIVDFPTILQKALVVFGNVFDTEAVRRHFAKLIIPNWRISSKILTLPETADENAQ